MPALKRLYLCTLCICLTQCISYDLSRKVVEQGNLLPDKKLQALHTGMRKEDVEILMGSSLIASPFDPNRWDYAYTYQEKGRFTTIKRATLYFRNGRLVSISRA